MNKKATAKVLRIESLENCKELTLRPVGYMHNQKFMGD